MIPLDETMRPGARRAPHRALLEGVRGFAWQTDYRGVWRVGDVRAAVRVETDGSLHVAARLRARSEPRGALLRTHALAGNARIAIRAGRTELHADCSAAHLDDLRTSLRGARRDVAPMVDAEDITRADLDAAVAALGWSDDDLVARDDGWELRPRLDGSACALRVELRDGTAWIYRDVAATLPSGTRGDAVAMQALRFNAQLRHSRLATNAAHGPLRIESRLPAASFGVAELAAAELERAARALAAGTRHAAAALQLLARSEEVARCYVRVLASHANATARRREPEPRSPQPTPTGGSQR